jgi:hypothetical protein
MGVRQNRNDRQGHWVIRHLWNEGALCLYTPGPKFGNLVAKGHWLVDALRRNVARDLYVHRLAPLQRYDERQAAVIFKSLFRSFIHCFRPTNRP